MELMLAGAHVVSADLDPCATPQLVTADPAANTLTCLETHTLSPAAWRSRAATRPESPAPITATWKSRDAGCIRDAVAPSAIGRLPGMAGRANGRFGTRGGFAGRRRSTRTEAVPPARQVAPATNAAPLNPSCAAVSPASSGATVSPAE